MIETPPAAKSCWLPVTMNDKPYFPIGQEVLDLISAKIRKPLENLTGTLKMMYSPEYILDNVKLRSTNLKLTVLAARYYRNYE